MSRRKDRRRFGAMRRLDPDYNGFRGFSREPDRSGNAPLEPIACSVCARKRNVPRGVALEKDGNFVCASCTAESAD